MGNAQVIAVVMGAVSSCSFPFGAMLGMFLNLPPRLLAGLLAYGGGALIFALASELFITHINDPDVTAVQTATLTISALLGALAFMKLANMLDSWEKKRRESSRPASTPAAAGEIPTAIVSHRRRIHTNELELNFGDLPLSSPHLTEDHGIQGTEPVVVVSNGDAPEGPRSPKANVALSMWLGVMLDSIPESMYFGFLAMRGKFSPALIVGVFFANLPEAVSSAAMQKTRDHPCKILAMWSMVTLLTSAVSLLATYLFPGAKESEAQKMIMLTCSGLAGGAMLGMVSSTMLPEAFEVGGRNVVSFSTVLGFLVAMLFSLLPE